MMNFETVKNDETIRAYLQKGNEVLGVVGFTEHGFAHAGICAKQASDLLLKLGYEPRVAELARIAGYLHDIGNCINRNDHAHTGALMAFQLLSRLGMNAEEVAEVIAAIGNHDEHTGTAVSPISAALILADKCDVRRSRVRKVSTVETDIHDRVNYAVDRAELLLDVENKKITLSLSIDTSISAVMDYFEIFLTRMLMCRKAAEFLQLKFQLRINETQLL
ncbi:HD domain-containing protein [Acidaminobacterium chupaoyuni]